MKQTLHLGLRQQLAMTPQLQLMIRLLPLSALELETKVQEEVNSNYMLEFDGENGGGVDDGEAIPPNGERVRDASGAESEVQPSDIPTELAVDTAWEDIYDGAPTYAGPSSFEEGADFESSRPQAETLRDHLERQLALASFSRVDHLIAQVLVDAIDETGYLRTSLEDVLETVNDLLEGIDDPNLPVEIPEIEAVLHRIQHFEPAGVGARDPWECLQLQLSQYPDPHPLVALALRLVRDHRDLYEARDFVRLQKHLGVDERLLSEINDFIKTLNPRPGDQVASAPTEYVIPDVIVTKHKGGWRIALNPDTMPKLRIHPLYANLVHRGDNNAENESMRNYLNEAKLLINSLHKRSETLLKVSTSIVERQQAFLEHGAEAMRPLILHDVAEALGTHESTISRATTRKYMHTPRGVVELKFFFSSRVSTQSGGKASSTAVKARIEKLISQENPRKPLSDGKLSALLRDAGVNVARRTVAKYREQMHIPSSSERRRPT